MDTLKAIEKLARKAREERIPVFDVANQVLLRIRSERAETITLIPFDLFAGVSVVAASIALFLAINSWNYITNPAMEFLAPLQEVPLW